MREDGERIFGQTVNITPATEYIPKNQLDNSKLLHFGRIHKYVYLVKNNSSIVPMIDKKEKDPSKAIKGLVYQYGPVVINVGQFEIDDDIFLTSIEYVKEYDTYILKCNGYK